ncbi:MAG TPA: hypothetical protein VHX14_09205 [Thermoanaerobaculia bacterium]|jgi:hypothetical protein|nr:hypothetical protein [Thermoanaerobaculia bacterium]
MALSIQFPEPDFKMPAEVPLFAVRHQTWTRESAITLARRLEISSEAVDAGLWMIARDKRAVLELYQATQSFRYSRLDLDGEGRECAERRLDWDEARKVAQAWIEPFLPVEGHAEVITITERELLVSKRRGDEPRATIIALDVNYVFTIDRFPLLGPGAKAKVSVHNTGAAAGGYLFWRTVAPISSVPTIPLEELFRRFSSSPLFTHLTDDNARAEVRSVRFGYLTIPPTEPMSALIPALELRGTISTEAQPRYDFIVHVAASELPEPGRAKEARLVNARSALLIA